MTRACFLKSRMKRKFHVRFGIGGGVGDCPTDHNWATFGIYASLALNTSSTLAGRAGYSSDLVNLQLCRVRRQLHRGA
jgi:hypothetical protein